MPKKLVAKYYDKCQKYYNWFWSDKESRAMHYGFWNKRTKSKKEALINQYREIVKKLKIKQGESVLDAGCGVGGASLWLAKKIKAKFTGITLSKKQVKLAKQYSIKDRVTRDAKFYEMDFFETNFKNNSFDKIFGIESFCHSYPKPEKVLKEMYRVLKNNGKIMISDGILLRHPKTQKEKEIMSKFYLGWKLNGGNTSDEIIKTLKNIGFKKITFENKTEVIKKNINSIYWRGIIAYPILKVLRFVRLIAQVELENAFAAIYQKKAAEIGLMGYGVFSAEK